MPPPEVFALVEEAIGAGLGKPSNAADNAGGQLHAIGDMLLPVAVVRAPARSKIEQLAGKPGYGDLAGILILELDQAALSAAVAERFPLLRRHASKGFALPERRIFVPRPGDIFGAGLAAGPFLLFCRLVSWHSTGG